MGTTQGCYMMFWIIFRNSTPLKLQLYSHLSPILCTNQVRWARRWRNKWCSPMDSYTWTHQCWLTCKILHSSARCKHWVLSKGLTKSNADAVKALSWIFLMYFLLFDGERPRLVKNMVVELVMKPHHLTLIGNILVIVLADPHIFPTYTDVPIRNFLLRGLLTE